MDGVLGAFLAQLAIITYRVSFVQVPQEAPLPLPLPATYLAAAGIYAALALAPRRLSPIASTVGWGLVVATLLHLFPVAKKHQQPGTPELTSHVAPSKVAKAPTTAKGVGPVSIPPIAFTTPKSALQRTPHTSLPFVQQSPTNAGRGI